jgi:hypothetical protein
VTDQDASGRIDWEAIEREQLAVWERALDKGDGHELPLLVSHIRQTLRTCRRLGVGRDEARNALLPPPVRRREGGLRRREILALLDEEWPS